MTFEVQLNFRVPYASVLESWACLSSHQICSSFPHLVCLERFRRPLKSTGSVDPAWLVHRDPSVRKELVLVTRTNPWRILEQTLTTLSNRWAVLIDQFGKGSYDFADVF